MAADDIEPTRMEAAKAAAHAFVADQPSRRCLIGVVAFSDGGLAVQVPDGTTQAPGDRRDRPARAGARDVARAQGSSPRSTTIADRGGRPPSGLLQQSLAGADPGAGRPSPAGRSARGDRPPDRRREHPGAGSARGGPGCRRPRHPDPHRRHRQRRGHRRSRSTGSQVHTPAGRGDASPDRRDHRRRLLRRRRARAS